MIKLTSSNTPVLVYGFNSIAELIDEAVINVNPERVKLLATDRAMVAAVDFELKKSFFEEYEVDQEQDIGLNIVDLTSILKRSKKSSTISFVLEDSRFRVLIKNGTQRRFQLPVLDISKEEVPNLEQLEEQFKVKVELLGNVLEEFLKDAKLITDAVIFSVKDKKFKMEAIGDVSKAEVELEAGDEGLISLEGVEARAKYPLDYLRKIMKASKASDSVSLYFANDFPLKISFNISSDVKLDFVVAPRTIEE